MRLRHVGHDGRKVTAIFIGLICYFIGQDRHEASQAIDIMSAFVSALPEFDSAVVGLNNNYASGAVFKSGSKTPLLATSGTVNIESHDLIQDGNT